MGLIGVMMAKAVVLLALLVVVSGATASSVSSLNFLLMVVNGSELVLSAADQALEEVNNDSTVLPHHRLNYTLRYTQVNMLNSTFSIKLYSVLHSVTVPQLLKTFLMLPMAMIQLWLL